MTIRIPPTTLQEKTEGSHQIHPAVDSVLELHSEAMQENPGNYSTIMLKAVRVVLHVTHQPGEIG